MSCANNASLIAIITQSQSSSNVGLTGLTREVYERL